MPSSSFLDSADFEHDGVFRVWTSVDYDILVFCPWKLAPVAHRVHFGKHDHQCAIADVALDSFSVEDDFVADFVSECAFSFLTNHSDFDC